MSGLRYNTGKLKWSLVDYPSLEPLVKVLEFGAEKYSKFELFEIPIIERIINEKLCQKQIAQSVGKVNVLFQKGYVAPAIQRKQRLKPVVVNVENIERLSQVKFYANLATRQRDYLKMKKQKNKKGYTKKSTTQDLRTKRKNVQEIREEEKILIMLKNKPEALFLETLLDTGLLRNNTILWCQEDVQSVEVQKDHTLTMTMKLENLEIYFVASATKLLDCYKIVLRLLEIYLNISININDISNFRSGVDNWKQGLQTKEIIESLLRHTYALLENENNDPESGLPHVGHILANAMFLSYMINNKPEYDNRSSDSRTTA